MYTIRRAEPADRNRIMELLEQVNRVHYEGRPDLFRPGTKYSEEELALLMEKEDRPIFVYAEEGQVLGYAFCILQRPNSRLMTDIKTLYIDDLCVDKSSRGRHVGTQLYQQVLEYARTTNCYNVTLNVWACNESAHSFYEHLGLKPQKYGMEYIL